MVSEMRCSLIILAGGSGERFGAGIPKQFIKLAGKPVICHAISAFDGHPSIDEIVVVSEERYVEDVKIVLRDHTFRTPIKVVVGGSTRQESSYNGLMACSDRSTHVLVHDAVRPFVDREIIDRCIEALTKYDAVDVCVDATDTIVEVDDHGDIASIPRRSHLKRGQTPQAFRREVLVKAHNDSLSKGITGSTDDCNLVLKTSLAKVHVVHGSQDNIKITYPLDIHLAEKIFQMRSRFIRSLPLEELSERLRNKVLVVIGGTSGIGRSICCLGEDSGAVCIPLSRATGLDVRNPPSIIRCLEAVHREHGRIDAVINTSGVLYRGSLESSFDHIISEQVDVNLTGAALVAKYSIPYLRSSHGKLVLFTSSSYTRGREDYAIYGATKAGVVNMVQALSDETAGSLDVIAINPQRTDTSMRVRNFGVEDKRTLLTARFVALRTLNAMVADNITGCVIDITMVDQERYESEFIDTDPLS